MAVEKKNSFQTFFGTAAEKAAFTGMLLGDKYFATDTGLKYVYTGAAWVSDDEEISINASDIEIGAVELKDATSDTRAVVNANGGVKAAIDQTTANANEVVLKSGVATSNYATAALAASGIIKATPGVLHSISITNGAAFSQYIQLFDSATLPANATVPLFSVLLQAGGFAMFDWPVYGKNFVAGIVWCNSSTHVTKTIGAADCFATATFK